ncbi:MAG TPA: hypothetical protein VMA83_12240 [Solirubrobacteraceae bacterium]|nr:hypothetical protein [Solirubrobacteraceae bacterium]
MSRIATLLACLALCGVVMTPAAARAATEKIPVRPHIVAAASLESAATKAGSIARSVAMSVIGIAFAAAAVVLAFRRDFRDAVAAFAVGVVAVLFATPAGVALLRTTVTSLFG